MRFKIQVADCKHGGCAHLCNHLISVIHPSIHPIFRTALSSLDSLSFKNISFFFFFFSLSYILQSRSFYFYFLIWQKTGIHRALIKICTQLDVSSPALQTLSCCWAVVGRQWLHFAPRSRQRLHPHPPHPSKRPDVHHLLPTQLLSATSVRCFSNPQTQAKSTSEGNVRSSKAYVLPFNCIAVFVSLPYVILCIGGEGGGGGLGGSLYLPPLPKWNTCWRHQIPSLSPQTPLSWITMTTSHSYHGDGVDYTASHGQL